MQERYCAYCGASFPLPRKGRSNSHWRWKRCPSRGRGYFTCRKRLNVREYARKARSDARRTLHSYLLRLLRNARERSAKYGRYFDLTIEDVEALWITQDGRCAYTGFEMTFDKGSRKTNASIERIDSDGGYTKGNVCLIQTRVNSMKMDTTLDEMIVIAEAIVERKETILMLYQRD